MATRYRIVELVIAVSVVVISVASLFVAVDQSKVMDRTLAASVMPIMDYETGNASGDSHEPTISFVLRNNGLGPAQVRSMEMSFQGERFTDLYALVASCCAPEADNPEDAERHLVELIDGGRTTLITNVIAGRVFAPQQEAMIGSMPYPDDPEGRAIWESLDRIRFGIGIEICYCSVLEDCWVAHFPQQTREVVDHCEPQTGNSWQTISAGTEEN